MQLSHFHPMIAGEWVLTLPITHTDGNIYTVTVEQYVEGFVACLTKNGKSLTNNHCYPTSRKAINAAAKW